MIDLFNKIYENFEDYEKAVDKESKLDVSAMLGILNRYETEIEKNIDDVEEKKKALLKSIQEDYGNPFKQCEKAYHLCNLYFEWLHSKYADEWEKSKSEIWKLKYLVLKQLLANSGKLYLGILQLLKMGLAIDAFILWRVLYENFITTFFLCKTDDSIADDFHICKYAQAYKIQVESGEMTEEEDAKIPQEIKDMYQRIESRKSYCWAEKAFENNKEVGFNKRKNKNSLVEWVEGQKMIDEKDFKKLKNLYRDSSKYVHPTPLELQDPIGKPIGLLGVKEHIIIGPSPYGIGEIGWYTVDVFLDTFLIVSEWVGEDEGNRIDEAEMFIGIQSVFRDIKESFAFGHKRTEGRG